MPECTPAIVHRLGGTDVGLMRQLLATFGEAFGEEETYTSAQPGTEHLERLLASDTFIALAALEGETVVGGLAAYELCKFEHEQSPPRWQRFTN